MSIEDSVLAASSVIGAVAAIAVACKWDLPTGVGVALGTALAVVNLYWLKKGAMLGRYALLALALYAIFMSHFTPFVAVLAGLLAAPAGLMVAVIFNVLWKPNSGSPTS